MLFKRAEQLELSGRINELIPSRAPVDSLLPVYPGKAIIIDRWATWCLPCLKSKVMELKQPGVHILIDETLDADISNYFSFSGYPGHALIDKTGQYKPGAIESMSQIQNRDALATLIGN